MKSLKKLQSVLNYLENQNTEESKYYASVIHEFIVDNESNPRKANIYSFCSNDNVRLALTGVYHDGENKVAVASDGKIMIISKNDYKEEHSGKIMDKYDKEITDCRFPKYRSAFPLMDNARTMRIDEKELANGIKDLRAKVKELGLKKTRLCVHIEDFDVSLDAELLNKTIQFSRGEYNVTEGSHVVEFHNEEYKGVIMPLYKGGMGYSTKIGNNTYYLIRG